MTHNLKKEKETMLTLFLYYSQRIASFALLFGSHLNHLFLEVKSSRKAQ
jgi:hypothetical protein